jgi:hypothetical protein
MQPEFNRSQGHQRISSPARLLGTLAAACLLLLGACNRQPESTVPAGMTPRAYVPAFTSGSGQTASNSAQSSARRVLFIQGDFVPDSGYPHSRVHDDGAHPESFTRLRSEVLEGELKLNVDEFVLAGNVSFDRATLAQYGTVVLGSNARVLTQEEVATLTAYYAQGGSVLVYADSQYGNAAWDSDNDFLKQFGIQVLADNMQPAVEITGMTATHPIFSAVQDIRGEGLSQFIVGADALQKTQVLAQCAPLTRSGCSLPQAQQQRVRQGDVVACVFTRENEAGGRLAGICDRNWFQNGPGPGSDLDQADNRRFATNLFRWLSKS